MRPAHAIEDQAAEWIARRCTDLSPDEEARFQSWLSADPRHAREYAELEAAMKTLS